MTLTSVSDRTGAVARGQLRDIATGDDFGAEAPRLRDAEVRLEVETWPQPRTLREGELEPGCRGWRVGSPQVRNFIRTFVFFCWVESLPECLSWFFAK